MSAAADLIRCIESIHDGNKLTRDILEPERDNLGIPTLGWGAIYDPDGQRVTMETPGITRAVADQLLERRDLIIAQQSAIKLSLPRVLLPHQIDAVTDFIYNMGAGRYRSSQFRAAVRDGRDDDVWAAIKVWRLGNGKVVNGLEIRRLAEHEIYTGMDFAEVMARLRARQALSRAGKYRTPTKPGMLSG